MLLEKCDITSCFVVSGNFSLFETRKNRLIEFIRYGSHEPVTFCELRKIFGIPTSSIYTLEPT